ncbi:acyl-CoA dehydrogenase family protein [Roseibium algae]|uniref:Acyl-CoA dehydrogenase family protein n=1 Tax=Roseibium algae TaxID=3123038 RepID=A0ABU8TMB4_9HYPH
MNFELTDERRMLADALGRFLKDKATPDVRQKAEAEGLGFSPDVWTGLTEIGVLHALFNEDRGGFGGKGFDLAVVFEALGRAGAVEPVLDTGLLAGGLLDLLGGEASQALIDQVMNGETQLALAHGEPTSRYHLARVETRAMLNGDDYVLNGRKAVVVNGSAANTMLVSARTSGESSANDGLSVFLVDPQAVGVEIRDYPLAGGGRAAELVLANVKLPTTALLGSEGQAYEAIATVHARAVLAQCSEAVGLMDAICALTTDYLKTRQQFGKPIGKFQALQHRMADMLIEIEQARSAVINLAGHLEADTQTRDIHVAATKNLISRTAKLIAEESIQLHGGIGMTMEYELGHLAKRLTMVDHRFGDGIHHLQRFIDLAVI